MNTIISSIALDVVTRSSYLEKLSERIDADTAAILRFYTVARGITGRCHGITLTLTLTLSASSSIFSRRNNALREIKSENIEQSPTGIISVSVVAITLHLNQKLRSSIPNEN